MFIALYLLFWGGHPCSELKVRQYNRCFSKCQMEKAAKLIDEIEASVDMTVPVNRQFVGMGRICENLEQKKLSFEYMNYAGFLEANNELEKSQQIAIEGLHHCLE